MSDNNVEEKIKQWYKGLPEITLPNLESEDGTHLEINLSELVKFTEALINKARIESLEKYLPAIDELVDFYSTCYDGNPPNSDNVAENIRHEIYTLKSKQKG